jgi:hypothetical protein
MTEPTRYAIATSEEIWVRACYQFFEKNGFWGWYLVPKETAFREIMISTRGQGNPAMVKEKLDQLYNAAGVKQL